MCGKVAGRAGIGMRERERGEPAAAVSCLLCFIVVFLDVTLILLAMTMNIDVRSRPTLHVAPTRP